MDTLKVIEIPKSHIDFAEEIAKVAEKYYIESFRMEYCPHFEDNGGQQWDRSVRGNAIIKFDMNDGRGRPCRNLSINVETYQSYILDKHKASSN